MNLQLAKKQGLKKVAIINIKSLHKKRDEIIDLLKATDINSKEYLDLLYKWRDINYVLQGLWKFKLNKLKHQSWLLPNCICPKMDNSDFGEHYYHTVGCVACEKLEESDRLYIQRNPNTHKMKKVSK